MFNLFDMMRSAQGGAAVDTMARQFGLNYEQAQRAMEALLPAFAMAFQRNATNPNNFANLLSMMGSGQYARFFDNPAQAFTAQAFRQGNDILGQVFGNKALSQQIAEQSAAVAGIAPEIMKQMMAPAAAMLMGGLSQTAASQGLAGFFDQLADMFRGGTPRAGLRSEPAAQDPFTAWAQMMTGMMGGAAPSPQPREASPPGDATPHPLGPWGAMMTGFMRGLQPEPEPRPESDADTPPAPRNPFDVFSQMFEAGREVQEQHLAALQQIFDAYWGAPPNRR
jgi:hypothetical protein